MQSKVCKKCNELKDISNFYTHKTTADGYRPACKPCSNAYQKTPEYLALERERRKARYPEFRERAQASQKKYRDNNKEKEAARTKAHRDNNREVYRKNRKEYMSNRRKNDPLFNLESRLRTRVVDVFRRSKYTKKSRTQEIIGCSWEELQTHLLDTWKQNYPDRELVISEVHIDHIIPLCTAQTEDELIKLNHYSNLQLLLATDNLSKGGRYSS